MMTSLSDPVVSPATCNLARAKRPKRFLSTLFLRWIGALLACLMIIMISILGGNVWAQCPELGPLQNYTGSGQVACPCFVPGEQAGSVFNLPPGEYPIEILKVGIAWASYYGNTPQSIEQALHIYQGGLPNPGTPIFSLEGPVLTDGVINEFDLEPLPGNKVITSGPFTVTLEFFNSNAGDPYAPSMLHDGNGCQAGKNVVSASLGGWFDACVLGVSGDWVLYVKYRKVDEPPSTNPAVVEFNEVPGYQTTCETVYIVNGGCSPLLIDGINGCTSAPFSVDTSMTNHSIPPGDSTSMLVCVTPTTSDSSDCVITILNNNPAGPMVIDVTLSEPNGINSTRTPNAVEFVSVAPNPFHLMTNVHFSLAEAMPVNAAVYTVDGRLIRSLASRKPMIAGQQLLSWNGQDDNGRSVASGVYLIRISTRLGDRVARAVFLK